MKLLARLIPTACIGMIESNFNAGWWRPDLHTTASKTCAYLLSVASLICMLTLNAKSQTRLVLLNSIIAGRLVRLKLSLKASGRQYIPGMMIIRRILLRGRDALWQGHAKWTRTQPSSPSYSNFKCSRRTIPSLHLYFLFSFIHSYIYINDI